MPFVTTLRLQSGDRTALDDFVGGLRTAAERKGVELHGPHTSQPETYRVPLYRRTASASGRYPPWEYTVYERVVDLAGHDEAVRQVAGRDPPPGIHVEVSVDRVRSIGSS